MSEVASKLTSLRDDVAKSSTVEDEDRDYIVTRLDEILHALYPREMSTPVVIRGRDGG